MLLFHVMPKRSMYVIFTYIGVVNAGIHGIIHGMSEMYTADYTAGTCCPFLTLSPIRISPPNW